MGFRSSILAGVNLVRQAIQSPNYVAGVSGWAIKRDGSAELNNATIRGNLVVGTTIGAGVNIPGAQVTGTVPNANQANSATTATAATTAGSAGQVPASGITGLIVANQINTQGLVIRGGDFLAYSGTPAAGTLFMAISQNGGTDAFGNVYPAGETIFDTPGTTILAQVLAKASQYGAGFWTRGFQAPKNVFSQLQGGLLRFNAVDTAADADQDGAVEFSIDDGTTGYTVLAVKSGAYRPTDKPAWVELNPSVPGVRTRPLVRVRDNAAGLTDLQVTGALDVGVTDYTTYTPTWAGLGGATMSTNTGWWYAQGDEVFFNIYAVFSGAGSGATTVTVTAPTTIYRGTRQVIQLTTSNVIVASGAIGNGTALTLTTGAGAVIDRLTTSTGGATNSDKTVTGVDVLNGAIITIQGKYRKA